MICALAGASLWAEAQRADRDPARGRHRCPARNCPARSHGRDRGCAHHGGPGKRRIRRSERCSGYRCHRRIFDPGALGMHVHMRGSFKESTADFVRINEAVLPLYLANGVTGVREMGGDMVDTVLRWRCEVARGERLAPRIATWGPKLDGAKPEWPGSIAVTTPDQARAAVRRVKAMGADFVKVYNGVPNISRDAYLAILDETIRQNISVTGHVPLTLTVEDVGRGRASSITTNTCQVASAMKRVSRRSWRARIGGNAYDLAVVNGYESPDRGGTLSALCREWHLGHSHTRYRAHRCVPAGKTGGAGAVGDICRRRG